MERKRFVPWVNGLNSVSTKSNQTNHYKPRALRIKHTATIMKQPSTLRTFSFCNMAAGSVLLGLLSLGIVGNHAQASDKTQPNQLAPKKPNPGIIPIQSQRYGELVTAWWQWALSIPETQNPLLDTTGAYAGLNQHGSIWFLAGTFGNSAERTFTIPQGMTLFMPVHNWIFGAGVFDCDPTVPGVTCDVPTLRDKAAAATTGAEVVEASIDGVPVADIRSYRALSPEPFSIMFPPDAVFGIPAGIYYPQVADGYWLMLTPLPKGTHTIRVHVVNTAAGIDMTLIDHVNVR
ncbi:MAG: hypothetical protein QOF48_1806 [Verrucomicrobiota bacterium]